MQPCRRYTCAAYQRQRCCVHCHGRSFTAVEPVHTCASRATHLLAHSGVNVRADGQGVAVRRRVHKTGGQAPRRQAQGCKPKRAHSLTQVKPHAVQTQRGSLGARAWWCGTTGQPRCVGSGEACIVARSTDPHRPSVPAAHGHQSRGARCLVARMFIISWRPNSRLDSEDLRHVTQLQCCGRQVGDRQAIIA